MKRIFSVLLSVLIVLALVSPLPALAANNDLFTDRDFDASFDERTSVIITLNGASAACDSDAVEISGSIITISDEGTYILTGSLDGGTVIVRADDKAKVQIVLHGASVTSADSAALFLESADKVFLTLADGTENALANGGTFAKDEYNIDGALFAKCDLTLNGTGALSVQSPAGHGIVCKDDLKITGGQYDITAALHGIDANDSVRVADGSVTVTSGKDGIHAENNDDETLGYIYVSGGSFALNAQGDGLHAGSTVQIEGGTFDITAGGGHENAAAHAGNGFGGFGGRGGFGHGMNRGPQVQQTPPTAPEGDAPGQPELPDGFADFADPSLSADSTASTKGVKAGTDMILSGGAFTLDTADDAFHAGGSITVAGGTFTVATGDDAFHADDTLTVTDGSMDIAASYEGLEALHIIVSGGDIALVATDDGLNAAGGRDESGMAGPQTGDTFGRRGFGGGWQSGASDGTILLSGGKLYIEASGDGIDSNGSLEITGGEITVCGPTVGDTATLDYDTAGTIAGATFMGTGGSSMAQSFSDASQGVVAVRAGNQAAGTEIALLDGNGNVLLSTTPALPFSVVILSSPDLTSGQSYTLQIGNQSEQVTAQ